MFVKDPPGPSSSTPGDLGMNIISHCYQEWPLYALFGLSEVGTTEVVLYPHTVLGSLNSVRPLVYLLVS